MATVAELERMIDQQIKHGTVSALIGLLPLSLGLYGITADNPSFLHPLLENPGMCYFLLALGTVLTFWFDFRIIPLLKEKAELIRKDQA